MKDINKILLFGAMFLVILTGTIMYGFGQFAASIAAAPPAAPIAIGTAGGPPAPAVWSEICGSDVSGTIYYGYRNVENLTVTTYIAALTRYYEVTEENGVTKETFLDTGAASSSEAYGGNYSDKCGKTIRVYFIADDGVSISGYMDMYLTDDKVRMDVDGNDAVFQGAKHAGLIFKARNSKKADWIYTSNPTAGEYQASGGTFYSTTSNSTGFTVASGDTVTYELYFNTNATADSTARFTDQSLLIGLDVNQTGVDWTKPTSFMVSSDTGIHTATPVSCPGKIGSDGYDYCWEITTTTTDSEGNTVVVPLVVRDSEIVLKFTITPVSGVNPDDDLKFGIFTSGYIQKTLSEDMLGAVYNKDDSGQTYLYTGQTATFSIE